MSSTNDYMNKVIRVKEPKKDYGDVIFRWKNGHIIPIRQSNEKRINDHTLEYNGYYIMSASPNVGYKYETLENAHYYSIYDANDDDITHNLANWINTLEEAKEHIDSMKKWGIYK